LNGLVQNSKKREKRSKKEKKTKVDGTKPKVNKLHAMSREEVSTETSFSTMLREADFSIEISYTCRLNAQEY
jgi:hypothetical protein